MKKLETIHDVINDFNKDNDFPKEYNTMQDVVNELLERGSTDQVHAFHDDYLGLEDNLNKDLLNSKIDNLDLDKYEDQIEQIVDEANTITYYYNRPLTDNIIEDIEEDKQIRGY